LSKSALNSAAVILSTPEAALLFRLIQASFKAVHQLTCADYEIDTSFAVLLSLLFFAVRLALVVPVLHVWLMFPLQTAYSCQPLPRIVGFPNFRVL